MSVVRPARSRSTPATAESAVRLSPLPAALLAADFTIVTTNDAWTALLGGAADRKGAPITSAVRGDERTALTLLLDKFEQSDEPALRLYVHLAVGRAELRRALLTIHRVKSGRAPQLLAHLIDLNEASTDSSERAQLLDAIEHAAWEWRRTFDAVESPIVIMNDDRTVGRINRSARMLAGREYSEIVGKAVAEIESAEPWHSMDELTGAVQKSRSPAARQVRDSAGRTLDLLAMLFNADDPNDGRVIVIVWDVTTLVDLQKRYEQQRSMATMGALVAGVAHEVRNPLFGISATLDAMEPLATPELAEYFEVLRFEIDRMSSLMRDLLAYGRPAAPNFSALRVGEVIEIAIRACAAVASKSSVTVRTDIASDPEIIADRDRLTRALQNVVENAIQHSPAGATVTVECSARTAASVAVEVRDQGKGFAEEDLPRVFEPFFSRRSGGTGLGLALVQQIVTEHGGQADVANNASGGACVRLTLPVARKR